MPDPSRPQRTLSRDEFLDEVRAAFREKGYVGELVVEESAGRPVIPGVGSTDFEHLVREIAPADSKRRAELLAKVAGMLIRPPRVPERWERPASTSRWTDSQGTTHYGPASTPRAAANSACQVSSRAFFIL